jgi:hypothetical protein
VQGAKHPAPSQTPQTKYPPLRATLYSDEGTAASISNRNTTEFRISPNPNKTQRILISNRNINPNVAINFSPPRSRRLTLTDKVSHSPTNPFLITDPRLETTRKPQKTKARNDF